MLKFYYFHLTQRFIGPSQEFLLVSLIFAVLLIFPFKVCKLISLFWKIQTILFCTEYFISSFMIYLGCIFSEL